MLNKFLIFIAVAGAIILVTLLLVFNRPGKPKEAPVQTNEAVKPGPSETLKEYTDPSGFKFSYPDNISVTNSEIEDKSLYASLQLYANGVNGSISIEVSDSKFKTIESWANLNRGAGKEAPKEVKLGELKAVEISLTDRVLLGALDQGILFKVEMPRIEEEFWSKVYSVIIKNFSFVAPEQAATTSSAEVLFEGEEVVE